ncbi:MAG: Asp-tRNA(Asn)/Glu-tRNA(Gln) amidotransferase subunit GatA [Thermotogota bacterium]
MINELKGSNNIEKYQKILEEKNKDLNAFISNDFIEGKKEGEFYGIPFAVKDNMNVEGTKTTCASKILKDYNSVYTATVIKRLLDKGFSIIGKTNLDEFAMGSSNEYSAFGPVKNPVDTERVPGGSSGGSAASVAAGMVPFSLGSDTGGSVRQPASFCGVVGYKPSYGILSRFGLTAFASSLDQIGVFSENIEDTALITELMKGKDENDSTTIDYKKSLTKNINSESIKGKKFAIPKIVYNENADKKITEHFNNIVDILKSKGAQVDLVNLEELEYSVSVYYIVATSEASSNLSRFDGARYGSRTEAEGLTETYQKTRDNGFGIEVKRRIMMGTFNLSSAYYDEYFSKASKVRKIIETKMDNFLEKYDSFILPTAPVLPPKFTEKLTPLDYYMMDMFTIPANLAGLPAISVPAGNIDDLPFGFQFIGKRYDDDKILAIANAFEKEIQGEVK